MVGQCVDLELLSTQKHAQDLYQAYWGHDAAWDYMISGPWSPSAQFYLCPSEVTRQQDIFLCHHVTRN